MLFSALHIGSRVSKASGKDDVYSFIAPTKPTFLTRAGQALVTGRYDKARPYAMEALLLYGICIYTENEDRDVNAWMIMGVGARLAMRMGYHRDPRHFPSISPFEGEMRRRAFMIVETFDLLLSSQAGLPAVIHEDEYDTQPPSNLFDTDFDEDSNVLPPSRPPTDPTPMLYYCYKGRVAKMLRRVIRHALSLKKPSYEDTMRIDNELLEMYKEVPQSLRMRPLSSSITDEAYQIFWRLNIDLLYQRSLCVLHRCYLSNNRTDDFFNYSRTNCTNAALQILKYQAEFHFACQPGGRFYNDRWMLSSLILHDFLVAAMIICLDLYEQHKSPSRMIPEDPDVQVEKLNALKLSYEIWTSRAATSRESRRASRILAVMLSKVTNLQVPSVPLSMSQQEPTQPSMNGGDLTQTLSDPVEVPPLDAKPLNPIDHEANGNDYMLPTTNAAEPLESVFNDPDQIDWVSLQVSSVLRCNH